MVFLFILNLIQELKHLKTRKSFLVLKLIFFDLYMHIIVSKIETYLQKVYEL